MGKKVALIEFNTWHQECLYPQLLFLKKSGYDVLLVTDARKQPFIESLQLGDLCACRFFDFKKLFSFLKLRKLLLETGVDHIVLNTAQGSGALKFSLLPLPSRIGIAGTLHNIGKLNGSFGQKLIGRKVKKYYLLADYLKPHFPKDKGFDSEVFEPVFLPHEEPVELHKPENEFWMCIPGYVEYKRRDYEYLVEVAKRLKQSATPKKAKFIVLGNASKSEGPQLLAKIKEAEVEDYFVTFGQFIPGGAYESYIKAADVLLPLIHPNVPASESYTRSKISGTFSLALGYEKPMLCHRMFEGIDQFNYPALYYSTPEEFIAAIGQFDEKKGSIGTPHPDFEKNRKQYVSLLTR